MCGLVGFLICLIPFGVFFGGIVAIVGIVFGFLGRSRAKDVGTGKGMATTGAALGIAGLIIGVVWLFVVGSIFNRVRHNIEIREGDFTVTPELCRTEQRSVVHASGTITNVSGFDKALVNVHVTVFDSRGAVIGGGNDFVGSVDSGETGSYAATIDLDSSTESAIRCEVSVG